MNKQAWSTLTAAFGVGCLTLLPATAQADVTVQKTIHFEEGVTGITSHDTTETDYIQGDKKREEDLRKFTGSVLGAWQHFRGDDSGSASVDIYLVGQNLHYDMDPKKKTYSQNPIYEPGEQQPSGKDQSQKQARQQQDPDTKITKNEFTVKETGQKKSINGFDTAEYLLTWDVETENTKTGDKGKWVLTADMWNTLDSRLAKAAQEERAYSQAYLKLMQMPSNPGEFAQFGLDSVSFSVSPDDRKAFVDKLHTIKGYGVVVDVKWEGGNPSAPSSSTQAKAQQANQNLDTALGNLLGSKSNNSQQTKQSSNNGMTTIFQSHTEVKSVDLSPIAASQFQLPADYQKD